MRKAPARSTHARSSSVAASEGESVTAAKPGEDNETRLASVEALSGQGAYGSGIFVVEREGEGEREERAPVSKRSRAAAVQEKAKKAMNPLLEQVTLVVYGWKSVEPGTLSWVFPSVTAAVAAARTMKNAVRWAIVAGRSGRETEAEDEEASAKRDDALDEARANGSVLIEQAG
jgi:hypothetical protein